MFRCLALPAASASRTDSRVTNTRAEDAQGYPTESTGANSQRPIRETQGQVRLATDVAHSPIGLPNRHAFLSAIFGQTIWEPEWDHNITTSEWPFKDDIVVNPEVE